MSLIGFALIVLALIDLVLMRERPGASKLRNPFLISMTAVAANRNALAFWHRRRSNRPRVGNLAGFGFPCAKRLIRTCK